MHRFFLDYTFLVNSNVDMFNAKGIILNKKAEKNLHKMNNYLNYKMFLSHRTCADIDIFLLQVHLLLLSNTSACYNFIAVKR